MTTPLLQDFYTELSSDHTPEQPLSFSSVIRLNPSHPVYAGHFPQTPVVPGVCLIQMIQEIVSQKLKQPLQLSGGDNIKFLAMVDPLRTPELSLAFSLQLHGDAVQVSVTYSHAGNNYVKFKGKFAFVQ
jgi:3-hydroxyacyl-[acyl-carrier-protein] dehydratase